MKDYMKIGRNIGAALGGIIFLLYGITPGFYFGSFGALTVLQHLMGGPVEATILARVVMVFGIGLGIFCTAAISLVFGSIAGTAVGYFTGLASVPAKAPEVEVVKVKVE